MDITGKEVFKIVLWVFAVLIGFILFIYLFMGFVDFILDDPLNIIKDEPRELLTT